VLQRSKASSGVRNPSRSSCDGCPARPGLELSSALAWRRRGWRRVGGGGGGVEAREGASGLELRLTPIRTGVDPYRRIWAGAPPRAARSPGSCRSWSSRRRAAPRRRGAGARSWSSRWCRPWSSPGASAGRGASLAPGTEGAPPRAAWAPVSTRTLARRSPEKEAEVRATTLDLVGRRSAGSTRRIPPGRRSACCRLVSAGGGRGRSCRLEDLRDGVEEGGDGVEL
jgi:hypothetical protein